MRGLAFALILWTLAACSGFLIGEHHDSTYAKPFHERERADVILDVFGEFRTVMARYLWVKMDLFNEVFERQKADPSKQAELMPLLRMITLLDPSITDAYDMIAYDLAKDDKLKEALAILEEGVRRTPKAWALWFRQALLLYENDRFQEAQEKAAKAVKLATDEFDILNSYRIWYWSAKKNGDRQAMRTALNNLIALRPREPLYQKQLQELDKSL